MPRDWTSFELDYRYGNTSYRIHVQRPELEQATGKVVVDGVEVSGSDIPLTDDGLEHRVSVQIGDTR